MAPPGNSNTGSGTGQTGSPCGACKFLRRKCAADCIFAPYFCSEQGPARFAAIHKVFGASNVSKMLLHIPVPDRCEAVVTIAYEAQARIRDPVYGCVAHIFALQQQVAYLQAQLMQVKAQMAHNLMTDARNTQNQQLWTSGNNNICGSLNQSLMFPVDNRTTSYINSSNNISPQSSIESVDHSIEAFRMQEIESRDHHQHQQELCCMSFPQQFSEKRPPNCDLGELQAVALRMMRN
ncbi:hypothetical protein CDL15_Pgr023780 [Punica granatum]|uniref:LOB domain-containing protein n=1 Tax=Punica granatum TaxID=22663 RepID=A0A218WRW6_PUNGR|nr:hypothetical protein CDL15_Pgr023780 [Punica granatum]